MKQRNIPGETQFTRTTERVITRRGVIWLGQTCNIRCHFCYFLDRIKSSGHPEHPFMTLEKAKYICFTLRHYYGNVAIDIQGGEPLLFKGIYDLVSFCSQIGLHPTLITNGILLGDRESCIKLLESGIRDLLISVHALGEVYDSIVGTPGASKKQMRAIRHCQELGIPFRFNVVLSKWALPQYVEIARLAAETGAKVVNFITFNPFEDQASGKRSAENVAKYSEVAEELNKALDLLEEAEIESNVRYLPICMVAERHRKSVYDFQQLPYDVHEWDYASWSWTGQTEQRMRDGECTAPITLDEATYLHGRPLENLPYIGKVPFYGAFVGAKRYVYESLAAYPRTRTAAVAAYHKLIDWALSGANQEANTGGKLQNPDPQLYRANARLRAENHCRYLYSQKCFQCDAKSICDGFHGDYVSIFGADEASPISGNGPIDDPGHFIAAQHKVVEKRDYQWVFGEPSEPATAVQSLESSRCPICHSSQTNLRQRRSDGEILCCEECDHLFLVSKEHASRITEAKYQGMGYWEQDRHHQGIRSLNGEIEWAAFLATRLAAITEHDIIPENLSGQRRILEIGCSEGKFLAELKQKGHLVLGIEPNREVAALGRKKLCIPILASPVEECRLSDGSFDSILSFHCFEHLTDPAGTVRHCYRWLAPGGRLLFEVPVSDDELDNLDQFHFFSPTSATKLLEMVFGNSRKTPNDYRRADGKIMGSVVVSAEKTD